ncbi:MAG: hypothetical protein ACT4NL_17930 [Pseudomarimonas sp.]
MISPLLALIALPAFAGDYAKHAEHAGAEQQSAITVFVDVDWGGREDAAARELTRAHSAFAAHGYLVVDVEGYTENGDLQGFFVTYRRNGEPAR